MNSQEIPKIEIQLNPNGVVAPAQQASVVCREVVDFYFTALSKADLSKQPEPPDAPEGTAFRFNVSATDLDAEKREKLHKNWILSKAFQDLMRGLRASLEEAFFFVELLAAGQLRAPSDGTLNEILRPYRDRAAGMRFPALLEAVNKRLIKPLEFVEAYKSMQSARNCLEHRGGIVGLPDVQADGRLVLEFPKLKIFIERNGDEVDVHNGMEVEGGEVLQVRIGIQRREYALGEQLAISAADFDQIAFACWQFAEWLGANLPKSAPEAATS